MQYNFEWDSQKAKLNKEKHGVTFEQAVTVFRDPRALSIYDSDHSSVEDRWITLGVTATGVFLVVNHTYVQVDKQTVNMRIISSRKATKREQSQYLE
ncbi:MAG: BrnT family toxin [Planctomycetota bacterium]|jgi:uncharacterized DUF497 family protein